MKGKYFGCRRLHKCTVEIDFTCSFFLLLFLLATRKFRNPTLFLWDSCWRSGTRRMRNKDEEEVPRSTQVLMNFGVQGTLGINLRAVKALKN